MGRKRKFREMNVAKTPKPPVAKTPKPPVAKTPMPPVAKTPKPPVAKTPKPPELKTPVTPEPPVAKPSVNYEAIPDDHKFELTVNDRLDLLYRYRNLINSIRSSCTKGGLCFDGKLTLACKEGFPLIQVTIKYKEKSVKVLISRATLYLLAFFCTLRGWRVFDDSEMEIVGENRKKLKCNAKYESKNPWRYVGPKEIIMAITLIESENEEPAKKGAEILMIHLCEAARFTYLQSYVERSMLPTRAELGKGPTPGELQFVEREEGAGKKKKKKEEAELGDGVHIVRLDISVKVPTKARHLIRKFKELSRAWMIYALTERKACVLAKKIAISCGVHNTTELEGTLSILCNTNVDKVLTLCEDTYNFDPALVDQMTSKLRLMTKAQEGEGFKD
ncbi:hypothetical protein CASFOL_020968 [Castilleja foliolosa]|uniref:rRNA N-glycosylase n=1 Tax=Castilleja foliolosa TaxID=1961234 RepID=A0ABD3D4G4_9LAMI